jgi:hypothetical protein
MIIWFGDHNMKITEISSDKEQFVRGITDPAAKEIHDVVNDMNKRAGRGYSYNVYHPDKELATIIGTPPRMDIETQEGNLIEFIKGIVNNTQHWSYKAWNGDVENGDFSVYIVRNK